MTAIVVNQYPITYSEMKFRYISVVEWGFSGRTVFGNPPPPFFFPDYVETEIMGSVSLLLRDKQMNWMEEEIEFLIYHKTKDFYNRKIIMSIMIGTTNLYDYLKECNILWAVVDYSGSQKYRKESIDNTTVKIRLPTIEDLTMFKLSL